MYLDATARALAGYNAWGQLGLCDQVERHVFITVPALSHVPIVSLACGDNHSAAVTESGELYLWGRGDCGQLGSGRGCSSWSPQKLEGALLIRQPILARAASIAQRASVVVPSQSLLNSDFFDYHCHALGPAG